MSKDAYWFPHDSNARHDPKIVRLRMKHACAGVGFYWCLIEFLREQETYSATREEIAALEFELDQPGVFETLLDVKLISERDGFFFSKSLLSRMRVWDEKRKRRAEAGRKGGIAKAQGINALALPEQCNDNAKALNKPCLARTEQNRTEQNITEEKNITPQSPKGGGVFLAKNYLVENSIDWISQDIWNEWIDYKRKVKASVTQRAIASNIKKLESFGRADANAVLAQSLDAGWKDVFPLRNKTQESAQEAFLREAEKEGCWE